MRRVPCAYLFATLALTASAMFAAVPSAVAIKNARVIIGDGRDLPRATVVLRNGLIEQVDAQAKIPADAWVIDGAGLTVYPGFIDGLSTWGLAAAAPAPAAPRAGSSSGNATASTAGNTAATAQGMRSHGPDDRPQTYAYERAADGLTVNDSRLGVARAAGYTSAATFPNRGIVEGLGAMVDLRGVRGRDMVVQQPIGQQIVLRTAGFRAGFPASLMGDIAYVRQLSLDGQYGQAARQVYEAHPRESARPVYDPDGEALRQSPRLLLPADEEQQIDRMLQFGRELGLPFVLYGLHEGFRRIDELQRAQVPVLISLKWPEKPQGADPSEVPSYRDLMQRDQAPATPALLQKAHVKFGFFSDGIAAAPELKKAIRKAVTAGLSPADAVRALTLSVAEIYGLDDRMGSLEKGKIANVVVARGAIFEEKSSIEYVFVDGAVFRPPPDVQNPRSPGAPAKTPVEIAQ